MIIPVPNVSAPSTMRGVRRCLAAGAVLGAALLGGCAGPTPPVANRAALAEEAYARNGWCNMLSVNCLPAAGLRGRP